jgi:hypothetical protein
LRGFSAVTDEAAKDEKCCCSSGLGATDLLRFSPPPDMEADRVAEAEEDEEEEEEVFFRWKGVNLRDLAEEGSGSGGSAAARRKDGGEEGEAEGGGWPPSGKKGLDLEEETSIPSFSCRQKAHIPPPAAAAAAAAPGLYGWSLQYWMPSSGSNPAPAWPSS